MEHANKDTERKWAALLKRRFYFSRLVVRFFAFHILKSRPLFCSARKLSNSFEFSSRAVNLLTPQKKKKYPSKDRESESTNDTHKKMILSVTPHLFDCRLQNTNIVSMHTGVFFTSFIVEYEIKILFTNKFYGWIGFLSAIAVVCPCLYHHIFKRKQMWTIKKYYTVRQ